MPFCWLETCSFMKGMSQKSVRLQASMMWAVIRKLVNLISFFFLHFGRPPFWKVVRRTCCRGVQLPPSNNQVCKKKSPKRVNSTRIFDFQLAALALKLNLLFRKILLSEKYQVIMWINFLENTFEWIEWVNLIVEDFFILQLYQKVSSFRDFVKDFSPKFDNTFGYLLPKRFLHDQKTCFFYLLIAEFIYC